MSYVIRRRPAKPAGASFNGGGPPSRAHKSPGRAQAAVEASAAGDGGGGGGELALKWTATDESSGKRSHEAQRRRRRSSTRRVRSRSRSRSRSRGRVLSRDIPTPSKSSRVLVDVVTSSATSKSRATPKAGSKPKKKMSRRLKHQRRGSLSRAPRAGRSTSLGKSEAEKLRLVVSENVDPQRVSSQQQQQQQQDDSGDAVSKPSQKREQAQSVVDRQLQIHKDLLEAEVRKLQQQLQGFRDRRVQLEDRAQKVKSQHRAANKEIATTLRCLDQLGGDFVAMQDDVVSAAGSSQSMEKYVQVLRADLALVGSQIREAQQSLQERDTTVNCREMQVQLRVDMAEAERAKVAGEVASMRAKLARKLRRQQSARLNQRTKEATPEQVYADVKRVLARVQMYVKRWVTLESTHAALLAWNDDD